MANVFTCLSCGLNLKSVKGYVDHQVLHRNDAHVQFPCWVADCKRQFVKYSAFKTHCYRHHKNPLVSELDVMQGPYTCSNTSCHKQCTDLKDLLTHLRSHLSKNELSNCPFGNCGKTFKVRSSFTSHISRIHKHAIARTVPATCSAGLVHTEPASDVIETDRSQNATESDDMPDDISMRAMYMKNLYVLHETAGKIPNSIINHTDDSRRD